MDSDGLAKTSGTVISMHKLTPGEIAHRDARRIATVLRDIGGEGAPVADGWMACDLPGSWADYAAGLGVQGPVEASSLDTLVDYYRAHKRAPRIQVTPYQHPSLLRGLGDRGFSTHELETVLVHSLDGLPQTRSPPGLHFRRIDPASDEDVTAFRNSQMAGFFGEGEPPPGMLPITDRVARYARCHLWLLELDGELVGSGGLELFEDAAVLIAGCVVERARRRGLHSSFLRFRLEHAARAGLRYATVGSMAGGPTERNALRAGFTVAFTQLGLHQT